MFQKAVLQPAQAGDEEVKSFDPFQLTVQHF
jgi:hypothetical protein